MKNYESPVIFDNEELAEGVYATGSGGLGSDCYTQEFEFPQKPEEGRKYFVIKATCHHNAIDGHHSNNHTLILTFDRVVNCSYAQDCNGIRNYGTTVEIDYFGERWHNNPHEDIGLADIRIDGEVGDAQPVIKNSVFTCDHACLYGHKW